MMNRTMLWRGVLAAAALAVASTAMAQTELKIMAPAAPGGGWDQTARSMQQALTQSGIVKSVQVTNVPGAGGTIGLAQFVNGAKGDGNQLMVNGYVMRSEEHTSELQSRQYLVCRLLLEKKNIY